MSENQELDFIYSTDFLQCNDRRFKGCCLHLLCTAGEGSFVFNDHCYHIRSGDLVIMVQPDKVANLAPHPAMEVEYFVAPYRFLYGQLPSNNFSIGGGISLYADPVIRLQADEARRILTAFRQLRDRMQEKRHLFYREMMGSLCQTMMYDIFDMHARRHDTVESTDRRSYVVRELLQILASGTSCTEREVAYYAHRLHVSPKYLSDTVRRTTGNSVTSFIDRFTLPILRDFLADERLSLTQISDRMNFASLSYFSRYCSKHLGMSASEYRASIQPTKSHG
ncbi:MAG: AraC family transcriptional regulator [Prevotella sp.]|nr:AraC family transcriptional regulator [Prevotella sp.]